jgi:predicted nuclease of predicted toxin-antitoxin system
LSARAVRILFDQGTPVPLRRALQIHEVVTAHERGWGTLQNGDLLRVAEAAGFEAIITTDQNLRYQQNLSARRLAILVLLTTDWRLIRQHTDRVALVAAKLTAGDYVELAFPP